MADATHPEAARPRAELGAGRVAKAAKKAAAKAAPASTRTGRPRGRPPARRPEGEHLPHDIVGAVARLKRDSIIAAAVDLFYRQGYARTSLDQVAEALHVSKPFIYAHFSSKAELLAEISSRAITLAHEALNRALAQGGTQTERLRMVVSAFLHAVLDHQAHAVIYSREETELKPEDREAINGLRRAFDHKLVGVLKAGVEAGEFEIDDVHLTALAIGGIVGWSPVWYRPTGRLGKEDAVAKLTELVLHMVRATSTPPRRARAKVTA